MNSPLENRQHYSVTISPPYRLFDPVYLYNEDIPVIVRWLNKFSKHYVIYTELDSSSRIHYHLSVWIHDMMKYHRTKHIMDRKVGFVKTKRLFTKYDLLRWHLYCNKDYYLNKKRYPRVRYVRRNRAALPPCSPQERNTIYNYFNIQR